MTKIFNPTTGRNEDISDAAYVDKLLTMVETKTSWEVLDYIVSVYMKKYKNTVDSYTGMTFDQYVENNKRHRKYMYDPKHGKGKENIGRMLLSIPQRIIYQFKKLYPDIFDGDAKSQKDFMHSFAKRYPQFVIPEKV